MTGQNGTSKVLPLKLDLPRFSLAEAGSATNFPITTTRFGFEAGPVQNVEVILEDGAHPGQIAEEIDLMHGVDALSIRLEQPFLGPLLERAGHADALSAVAQDPALAGMVLEHLLTPALGKFEAGSAAEVRIESVSKDPKALPPVLLRVRFRLGSDLWGKGCAGELVARSQSAAETLRRVFAPFAPTKPVTRLDLCQPCRVIAHSFQVPHGDLADLVPGDGLLLPPEYSLKGPLSIGFSPQHWAQADWRGDRMIVTGIANSAPFSKEIMTMQGFNEDSVKLDELPVTLSLELDRIDLSFAALGDLRVGSVVPFQAGVPDKARVLVNGRPFAMADLVQVDDRLGVRITSLLARTE
jgi:type III secretion system YscQ/HrcQ family protein